MNRFKNIIALIPVFSPAMLMAEEIEMADIMRSNGKIFVVVTVMAIVFIGIVIYLIRLDRKISKLEKSENNKA